MCVPSTANTGKPDNPARVKYCDTPKTERVEKQGIQSKPK